MVRYFYGVFALRGRLLGNIVKYRVQYKAITIVAL